MNDKVRELLLALCDELLDDDELVELARGGSRKGRVTRVATQSGVDTYGVPIGTIITEDMKVAAKARKGQTASTNPPSLPNMPKPSIPKSSAQAKPTDVASKVNAEPTKMKSVHTHPRVPGAKVYEFDDGTAVIEDAKGTRSKRSKMDVQAFAAKGWKGQEIKDEEGSGSGDQSGSGVRRTTGGNQSDYEKSQETLTRLKESTNITPKGRKALTKFMEDGPEINAQLRRNELRGDDNIEAVDGLREILEGSISKEAVTVHKGMSFNSPEERDTFVSSALKPGTSFVDQGFSLVSANIDDAQLHADGDNADNPGVIMNISVPAGSRIASVGGDDQDVLLPDKSKFKVDSMKPDVGGRPIVEATYIDPMRPAHERLRDEENPAVSPEDKEKLKARRFAWSSEDIHLDHIPDLSGQAPTPAPVKKESKPSDKVAK